MCACKWALGIFSPLLKHPELQRAGVGVFYGWSFTKGAVSSRSTKVAGGQSVAGPHAAMRAQLAAALRAQPQDEGNADTNALRALHKKRTINVLATTVKTSVDVRVVLEDPKLPSKQDLGRWWPEPARETLSPLVPFPTRPAMDTFDAGFKVVSHASPPSTSMRGSLGGSLMPGFASPPLGSPSAAMARSASALVLPRSASLPAVARDGKSAPATASPLSTHLHPSSTHGSPLGSINARGQSRIGGKWRSKPRLGDPSANLGNPAIIELPDGGADTPLDVFENLGKGSTPYALAFSQQLETLDRSSRLVQWMNAFAADEEAFASKAVFVEMRLRQALSSSVSLGVLERASNHIWTSALHARAHHGAIGPPTGPEHVSDRRRVRRLRTRRATDRSLRGGTRPNLEGAHPFNLCGLHQ